MSRSLPLRGTSVAGDDALGAARFADFVALVRARHDACGVVLTATAVAALAVGLAELSTTGDSRALLDALQAAIVPAGASVALGLLARRGPAILDYRMLTASIVFAGLGMLALDLTPVAGLSLAAIMANTLFGAAVVVAMPAIIPKLFGRLDRRAAVAAAIDGLIMLLAGVTVLVTLWQLRMTGVTRPSDMIAPVLVAGVVASAGVAVIAALAMRAEPRFAGVWSGIAGVVLVGLTWIILVDRQFDGAARQTPETILFALGVIVLVHGWRTWNDRVGNGRTYERVARSLSDWLPNASILACVILAALPRPHEAWLDATALGTAAVVVVAIARQRLLLLNERETSSRFAREVDERAATMWSLARLEPADTVDATAGRICAEALRLDGIDSSSVYAFGPNGDVAVLAHLDSTGSDQPRRGTVSGPRALYLQANAALGPWLDLPADMPRGDSAGVLREAFAPMRWDDSVVGVVAMGTTDRSRAGSLAERLPTVAEFGVVSAAMLGPMLAAHWRRADLRRELEAVIAARAFRPVFQPIVDLSTRRPVGYEALTRFADGTRPDKRFIEAAAVGMSHQLESACLAQQLDAATWLPAGTWVSLNVSPGLVTAIVPLTSALEQTDRDVVIEVTEHAEIADYAALGDALAPIRGRARLAVDDAGAGYAGLRHILELRPHFVKLDISLVRSIDVDAARQAMVAGMAHFARNADCELIAEGIETPGELAALVRLGIRLGQGYLLGQPAPLE